jgi:hypothetical protein
MWGILPARILNPHEAGEKFTGKIDKTSGDFMRIQF